MNEKWIEAQKNERNHHDFDFSKKNYEHYKFIYQTIFSLLDINFNFQDSVLLEVGPGVFGCLLYCENYKQSYIVEPMEMKNSIKEKYRDNVWITEPITKELQLPKCDVSFLFNVLQHTDNPDDIVEKLKEVSNIIYFFEPINTGTDKEHISSFNLKYFEDKFGSARFYKGKSINNFHTSDCAFGKWKKE